MLPGGARAGGRTGHCDVLPRVIISFIPQSSRVRQGPCGDDYTHSQVRKLGLHKAK